MDQGFTEQPLLPLDEVWRNHFEKIRNCRKNLQSPLTLEGKKMAQEVYNNPVFSVYTRLQPIFSGLINLVEAEEILGKDFFDNPTNQIIVIKALSLLIEDQIKYPHQPNETKKYDDYQQFFNHYLERLKLLEEQIGNSQKPPNLVNSLIMIFSQRVNELPGVENFNINIEEIRRRIREYLPELEKIDEGKILKEIKNCWQEALVDTQTK